MTQDVEMKELPAPSNSVTSTTPSPLQHLKEIASLIEAGAYAREVRRILRAVRLTIALRKKLKASVISHFLSFVLLPGSELHSRLSSYLPKAPFDASSVDIMRRLVVHDGVPGHIYPLALLCHDIMPPPSQVEKEIGERRVISFHGTRLSVATPINFPEIATSCEDPEEVKEAYAQALYNSVHQQYDVLKSAIHGKQGLEASIPPVLLSQPWN